MLDTAELTLIGGRGGNGAVSFLREKFRPRGGPDGGDGGDGGPVLVRALGNIRSLDHLEGMTRIRGGDGAPGRSKDRAGRKAKPTRVDVPVGTVVWQVAADGERALLTELTRDGAEAVVAYAGRGGEGNARFATATNQEPLLAIGGEPGEERSVLLEVKLLADAALVGAPNVGKSTLLSVISRAKPKVADYPFTTLEPVFGVVEIGERRAVVLDVPGLIEDAHLGRGLGLEFLRHCERAAAFVHLVDGMSPELAADYATIDAELAQHGSGLDGKPRVVAVTKADIPEARERFAEQRAALGTVAGQEPLLISAATGEGVPALLTRIAGLVPEPDAGPDPEAPAHVPRMRRPGPRPRVERTEDGYAVACAPAERILEASNLGAWRARMQFHRELERLGVIEALQRAGAGSGDTVRIADFEFVWE